MLVRQARDEEARTLLARDLPLDARKGLRVRSGEDAVLGGAVGHVDDRVPHVELGVIVRVLQACTCEKVLTQRTGLHLDDRISLLRAADGAINDRSGESSQAQTTVPLRAHSRPPQIFFAASAPRPTFASRPMQDSIPSSKT